MYIGVIGHLSNLELGDKSVDSLDQYVFHLTILYICIFFPMNQISHLKYS